jgi:hypothetical protein
MREDLLVLDHGFNRSMLTDLVRGGLAVTQCEVIKAGDTAIEVGRIRITVEGRRAIEG